VEILNETFRKSQKPRLHVGRQAAISAASASPLLGSKA
jgi:hypothetical protein